jgi:ankyrin repeat protein
MLLAAGAPVDAKDSEGRTALHYIADAEHASQEWTGLLSLG